MSDAIDRAARALWDYDNADSSAEWREMAWDDMGGSERSEERVEYELRARALHDAGLLAPAPLREEWGVGKSWEEPTLDWVYDDPSNEWVARDQAHCEAKPVLCRFVTDWLPADGVSRAEGDGRAITHE